MRGIHSQRPKIWFVAFPLEVLRNEKISLIFGGRQCTVESVRVRDWPGGRGERRRRGKMIPPRTLPATTKAGRVDQQASVDYLVRNNEDDFTCRVPRWTLRLRIGGKSAGRDQIRRRQQPQEERNHRYERR